MKKLIIGIIILVLVGIGFTLITYPDNSLKIGDMFTRYVLHIEPEVSQTEKTIWINGGVYSGTFKEFFDQTLDSNIIHYTIMIHTNGGNADSTVGIMSRIKELKLEGKKFTTVVYGKAFSAGAFMFMMGDERIMYAPAQLMWHTVRGQAKHNGYPLPDERAKMINTWDGWVVQMFRDNLPMVPEHVVQLLLEGSGMSWMSAQEALWMGIATEIRG